VTVMDTAHHMNRSDMRFIAAVLKAAGWLALILAPAAYLLIPVLFKF